MTLLQHWHHCVSVKPRADGKVLIALECGHASVRDLIDSALEHPEKLLQSRWPCKECAGGRAARGDPQGGGRGQGSSRSPRAADHETSAAIPISRRQSDASVEVEIRRGAMVGAMADRDMERKMAAEDVIRSPLL